MFAEQYNLSGTMTPTERQQLKWYQEECLELAERENIIVHLDSNMGKTLIAMRLIEKFLNNDMHRGKVAVMLVPSQPLIDQHAKSCKDQIEIGAGQLKRPPRILKVVENEQRGWGKVEWQAAVHDSDIFVATLDLFRRAMINQSYIQATQFSVMVFDECHHAAKSHPMAVIVRDGIRPHYKRSEADNEPNRYDADLPRLLGLTASFIKGRLENLEQSRQELEVLFNARIVCPDVNRSHTHTPIRIPYHHDEHHTQNHIDFIRAQLQKALNNIGSSREIKKVVKASLTVFAELGRESLLYYVEHAIVHHVANRISVLKAMVDDENALKAGNIMAKNLPQLQAATRNLRTLLLRSDTFNNQVPLRTPKLLCLLHLLNERFSENATDGFRGIVNVNDLSLVPTLAKQINDHFPELRCGVVTGSRAQPMSMRNVNLDAFRTGMSRIIVATSVIEEGIDVPECRFCVVFNKCKTVKSYIQITGRVRHPDAEHYYFENDPHTEKCKAAKLVAVAKDTSLSLTKEERRKVGSRAMLAASLQNKYPYPFGASTNNGGGTVNLRNCKEIFVDYCRAVLFQPIRPSTELYKYDAMEVLMVVRYPSPSSWQTVSQSDVCSFWGDLDLPRVFPFSTTSNLSLAQKRERLFVYVVVIQLREKGLLTVHNLPSEDAEELSKQCCTLRESYPTAEVSFKSKAVFDDIHHHGGDEVFLTNHIQLSSAPNTLHNYLQVIFQRSLHSDDFIAYSMTLNRKMMPETIYYPTPNGWHTVAYEDYLEVFQDRSVGDQLPPTNGVQKSPREMVEIAMMYLVVLELHKLGCLDDDHLPCLSFDDRLKAQNNCPLPMEKSEAPLPDVVEMSVASSLSDMNISKSILSGRISGDISMGESHSAQSRMQTDPIDGATIERNDVQARYLAEDSGDANHSHNYFPASSVVSRQFDDADSDVVL